MVPRFSSEKKKKEKKKEKKKNEECMWEALQIGDLLFLVKNIIGTLALL